MNRYAVRYVQFPPFDRLPLLEPDPVKLSLELTPAAEQMRRTWYARWFPRRLQAFSGSIAQHAALWRACFPGVR